ncbi:DUF454 family protein [Eubacterium oxidoreducens]|uniref:ABC-type cobalamin/Fe3+-siderophores transport system, ATPase component n=1 Tax=Eubacterium oxidoreducens TaxID=1732 RepID=A0A1G6A4B8_EUBOX|nr:ABC-type cobalamin/Fe3+-siderophores transport system, ATPase component [Eubacterium oxidoreducens]
MENKRIHRPEMEVRDLCFAYGKNRVLKGINLQVEKGKITTIMGANGCGKSTLFNVMTKNLVPMGGQVFLRGKNIWNLGQKEYARQVAIVHQHNTAPGDMTVRELIRLGRTPYKEIFHGHKHCKMPEENMDEDYVDWAMKVTGVDELKDREMARLSGGQRQRVWIAMALAQDTKILFLDEPTTYLDIRYQIEILELVQKLNRNYGITIIMVLHDINQAIAFSHCIIGLKNGKVQVCGLPKDVITKENLKSLYGISLSVTEEGGEKVVVVSRRDGETPRNKEVIARPRAFGQKKEAEEEKKKSPKNKRKKSRSKVVRALWAALGCVCLTLGTVGVVLPILPTVPFYLVTIFCFAKSSDRLYQWFTDTKLYHKHLENFVKHRAMTVKTKAAIMISVTAVMAFGFIMMHSVPIGRIILACVWVMHLIIFLFVIKTISREEEERLKKIDGKNDIGESVNYD